MNKRSLTRQNWYLAIAVVGLTIALIAHPPVQIAIALWMSVSIVGYVHVPVANGI